MLVIIDNYDSFTYNLVQRFGEIGLDDPGLRHEIAVYRNDQVTLDELDARKPTHLVISPGPCTPKEGGISNDAIRHFFKRIPVLGVCLGHQCIGHSFGAAVVRAGRIMHGKTSEIHHDGRTLFAGLSNPFTATRYHSLMVEEATLGLDFEVSARSEQNECMALRHKSAPLEGVQFHPESFLTTEGTKLLANFLRM
ncbi:MAG: anthranilate/aminodeoxychorismate synthase component II [Planctomycetota bacterium]|nr:MAG: anthranilate/aminodeoxychorismate synthase component II [Planctomycetota bacterium]